MDDYLFLVYLNVWEYCYCCFYLEYVLGEMEINEYIIRGNYFYCNINEVGIFVDGDIRIYC